MKDKLFIFGDFKRPSVNWTYDCENIVSVLLPMNIISDMETKLLYYLLRNGLQLQNNCFTYQNKLFDLIFSNRPDVVSVVSSACPLSRIDLYHIPIDLLVNISVERNLRIITP